MLLALTAAILKIGNPQLWFMLTKHRKQPSTVFIVTFLQMRYRRSFPNDSKSSTSGVQFTIMQSNPHSPSAISAVLAMDSPTVLNEAKKAIW